MYFKKMTYVETVISRFGGLRKMAKALDHKHPTTVQGWKAADRIPSWRMSEIKEAARANNIALPNPEEATQ